MSVSGAAFSPPGCPIYAEVGSRPWDLARKMPLTGLTFRFNACERTKIADQHALSSMASPRIIRICRILLDSSKHVTTPASHPQDIPKRKTPGCKISTMTTTDILGEHMCRKNVPRRCRARSKWCGFWEISDLGEHPGKG